MERLRLNLPLLLKAVNHILVAPTDLVRETLSYDKKGLSISSWKGNSDMYLHGAVLATRLQSENTEGLRHNHPLLLVIRGRDALKELETLQSGSAASGLVGDHTANGPVENLGRCAVVEGTGLFGVDNVTFVEEVVVTQLDAHV